MDMTDEERVKRFRKNNETLKSIIQENEDLRRQIEWIPLRGGFFPQYGEEVICWNGSNANLTIFTPAGFEVKKYFCTGDRTLVSCWSNVTHWKPFINKPPKEDAT